MPKVGQQLGFFRIIAPLGAGGMGEVWRAEDTRLGREVAIKLLPAEFAGDAERMGRLEREARVLASLNHPNIAHLYGLETVNRSDSESEHNDGRLGGTSELRIHNSELPATAFTGAGSSTARPSPTCWPRF